MMLTFITNNFEVSALEVARLYRNRWQIEVFFKWIKQNLTFKLMGHSENAVNSTFWIASAHISSFAQVKQILKANCRSMK